MGSREREHCRVIAAVIKRVEKPLPSSSDLLEGGEGHLFEQRI